MWTYPNKTIMNNLHLHIYKESSKGIKELPVWTVIRRKTDMEISL